MLQYYILAFQLAALSLTARAQWQGFKSPFKGSLTPRAHAGFSAIARNSYGPDGFSEADTDDLDYDSLLAMPSADLLAQLIALSNQNQAAQTTGKAR